MTLEIDVRDIDQEPRDRVVTAIGRAVGEIAARRGLAANIECLNSDPPARSAAAIVGAIRLGCEELGFSSVDLISRAYHDTLFMARVAPAGMIFIPCKGGISHRPDESCKPQDIARGVKVLALALARCSRGDGFDQAAGEGSRESVAVIVP